MDNGLHERLVFKYAIENHEVLQILKIDLFKDNDVKTLFKGVKEHFDKFKLCPTDKEFEIIAKGLKITAPTLRSILNTNTDDYTRNFLRDLSDRLIIWRNFEDSLVHSLERFKLTKEIPHNAKELVEESKMSFSAINLDLMDTSVGLDFDDVDNHFTDYDDVLSTGHKWIDNLTGGYKSKTLNVYVGFANVGKSILLCNDAASFMKRGYDVIYVSAEMSEFQINQRIGANLLNISIDTYRDIKNKPKVKHLLDSAKLNPIPLGFLKVKQFPTSCATVDDIETFYKKVCLEKGRKPRVVFVDYLGILATKQKTSKDYEKLKYISEELRAFAIRNDVIVVTASQLNRSADNATDITMSQIAESMGINTTADLIPAIIQTSDMKERNEYLIKLLKVRDGKGKNLRCRYDVDYDKMRLSETDEISYGE